MEFRISDTFTGSLSKLTGDEKKAVKMTAFDLQFDPVSTGMQFHKLDRAKDKHFLSVAVWPDSFKEFARLKENCLRLGYDYQLLPLNDVESIFIGSGGSASVQ